MTTSTFGYTGAAQSFTVPPQCTSMKATLKGGKGGGGALPEKTVATFTVVPGQILHLYVGGSGGLPSSGTGGDGGWNGGGKGGTNTAGHGGRGGGGATDIRIGGTTLADRVLVAGGSGGAGGPGGDFVGGRGGGTTGEDGDGVVHSGGNTKGHGGTQLAGGAGGVSISPISNDGIDGSLGNGGRGCNLTVSGAYCGGGGGGGYYGGGGAGGADMSIGAGGGGGGSGYVAAAINGDAPTGTSQVRGTSDIPSQIVLEYNTAPTVVPSYPTMLNMISTADTTADFGWVFTDDAGDSQSAYDLVVEKNSDGSSVLDTGKTTDTDTSPNIDVSAFPVETDLRWKVEVWDQSDAHSAFTAWTLFRYGNPPTFTITPADSSILSNGRPVVSWDDVMFGGSRNQIFWRVQIVRTSDSAVIRDASGISGTSDDPGVDILQNGETYDITVTVEDSGGLSTVQTVTVTTSYTVPDSVDYTVDTSVLNSLGYVLIDWGSAVSDPNWYAWRVYRKGAFADDWELLTTITDLSVHEYHDWLVAAGLTYMYSVTQVSIVSGEQIESPVGYTSAGIDANTYDIEIDNYWIIDTVTEDFSVMIPNVTSAGITEMYEEETYTLIGRGRKKDYGTRLGYTGTLSAQLRGYDGTPALIRAKLEAMRAAQDVYWLRTPFGDLFMVGLGDCQFDAIAGVGPTAMYDIQVPFDEVSGEVADELSA